MAACGRMAVPAAEGPKEGEEEKPRHVGGSEERREECEAEEDRPPRAERALQDLVLAVEAGERRDPGDRERADEEGPERPGDLLPQPAHPAHVLLARQRVDD